MFVYHICVFVYIKMQLYNKNFYFINFTLLYYFISYFILFYFFYRGRGA